MSISISKRSILLIIFSVIFLFAIWDLRAIVLSLILAYILVAGLRMMVKRMEEFFHLGYKSSSTITFFSFLFIALLILSTFIGPLISQFQLFIANFPNILSELLSYLNKIGFQVSQDQLQTFISPALNQIFNNLVSLTFSSISLFLFVVSVFVITFYFLLDHDRVIASIASFFPEEERRILKVEKKIEASVGGWVVGQIFIAVLVGIATAAGLLVFRINYFLPLTLIAFFFSPIAGIGPAIALIPAVVVAAVQSPLQGVWIFIFYNILQTVKDNFVVPRVMSNAIGLNPFMILFVLLVGTSLFGFLGAIVSVPAAVGLGVIFEDLREGERKT